MLTTKKASWVDSFIRMERTIQEFESVNESGEYDEELRLLNCLMNIFHQIKDSIVTDRYFIEFHHHTFLLSVKSERNIDDIYIYLALAKNLKIKFYVAQCRNSAHENILVSEIELGDLIGMIEKFHFVYDDNFDFSEFKQTLGRT